MMLLEETISQESVAGFALAKRGICVRNRVRESSVALVADTSFLSTHCLKRD